MLESRETRRFSTKLLLGAAVLAVAGAVVVIVVYGAESLVPGLVGGFAASLAAFLLALTWERDQELRRLRRAAEEQESAPTIEVRRRLASVWAELEKDAESLRRLEIDPKSIEVPEFVYVTPQLLWGAWTASAPRLSELVADYDLIADLATTYGRLEELRWRLRYRTESRSKELDRMTAPLVDELREEVTELIKRIAAQIDEPNIQPVWLMYRSATAVSASAAAARDAVAQARELLREHRDFSERPES